MNIRPLITILLVAFIFFSIAHLCLQSSRTLDQLARQDDQMPHLNVIHSSEEIKKDKELIPTEISEVLFPEKVDTNRENLDTNIKVYEVAQPVPVHSDQGTLTENSQNSKDDHNVSRKVTNRKPLGGTPAFKEALSRYMDLHSKVLANDPSVKKRFAVAEVNWAGVTNRLQSIVSTFLFALLTDRVFLLDWKESQGGFNPQVNNEGRTNTFSIDTLFVPPFDWSRRHLPPGRSQGNSFESGSSMFNLFMCGDLNENFRDDLQRFSSWDYWGIFLAHNSNYQEKIMSWFGSPDNLYEPIAHFLFQPRDDLQQKIDEFIANNFRKYTVGLHLRTKGNFGYVMEKEHIEAALQCAGVPFGDGINPPGLASVVQEKLKPADVAFFIATDAMETNEFAKRKYPF